MASRVSLQASRETRGQSSAQRTLSPWSQAFRRFKRHRLAVASLVVLAVVALLSLLAPWLTPWDPNIGDLGARNQGPSGDHWFGTDRTGRDTFTRTLYAGRLSLLIGAAAASISLATGTVLGAVSGYAGRRTDTAIMRVTDVVMTFPSLIIILTVVALTGPGLLKTVLIIGLLSWPIPCRLVRARFLTLKNQEFVQAARAIGATSRRVVVVHALPNTVDVLVVYTSFALANAILVEAGLSFLGLGVQPPDASWGTMLNVARNLNVLQNGVWQWMPAGVAIVLTVLASNFVGDGLRDALDPRMKL